MPATKKKVASDRADVAPFDLAANAAKESARNATVASE